MGHHRHRHHCDRRMQYDDRVVLLEADYKQGAGTWT